MMITEEEFNEYCNNIYKGRHSFSYRFISYNECAKNSIVHKPRIVRVMLESDVQEHIDSSSIYGEFRIEVLTSMQKSFIMAVARLCDPAYFGGYKTKPNLGLLYLKENINDELIQEKIDNIFKNYNEFIDSIEIQRHKRIAHNTIEDVPNKITKGIEAFFEDVVSILKDIRKLGGFTNSVPNLNVIECVAQAGVSELFKKII